MTPNNYRRLQATQSHVKSVLDKKRYQRAASGSKRQTGERGRCQEEGSNTDFPHGTISDSSWTSDGFHRANEGSILTHPMDRATVVVSAREVVTGGDEAAGDAGQASAGSRRNRSRLSLIESLAQ